MSAQRDFEAFVPAASPRLMGLATVLTGNRSDGEDLLQSAFLRVYRRWENVASSRDDPTAYMRRVLVKLHIDEQRRGARSLKTLRFLVSASRGDLDDPADTVTGRASALALVRQLPPRQRGRGRAALFRGLVREGGGRLARLRAWHRQNLHHQAMQKLRQAHAPAGRIQEGIHG